VKALSLLYLFWLTLEMDEHAASDVESGGALEGQIRRLVYTFPTAIG